MGVNEMHVKILPLLFHQANDGWGTSSKS